MKRSGMLRPTCCEIIPRDQTVFETYTTNLHYTPQLHKLFVGGCVLVRPIFKFSVVLYPNLNVNVLGNRYSFVLNNVKL